MNRWIIVALVAAAFVLCVRFAFIRIVELWVRMMR